MRKLLLVGFVFFSMVFAGVITPIVYQMGNGHCAIIEYDTLLCQNVASFDVNNTFSVLVVYNNLTNDWEVVPRKFVYKHKVYTEEQYQEIRKEVMDGKL